MLAYLMPLVAVKMRMLDCHCLQRRKQSLEDDSHEIPSVGEIGEEMSDPTPSWPDLRIHAVEAQRI